ncbi:MAG: GH3 auxin-responsive promoter family protein [Lachnospiraceae bacterium]|nr:GH3 auxin-responsive promoter family protein [Lachnospiraceae bacterium]
MDISKIYPELDKDKDKISTVNKEVLLRILKDNADTEIGRRYGFGDISSEEEYRKNLPVSHYKDYASYIQRMEKGEKNLITSYDIFAMLETSGSTDEGKLIPITNEAFKRYGNVMDRYLQQHVKDNSGKRLFISFLLTDLNKDVGKLETMLYTASYYRYLYEAGLIGTETLAGEKETNFFPRTCDYMYAKLWTAFASEDISSMESVYLYDFLIFFQHLENDYDIILNDMERGRVSPDIDLPESVKHSLEKMEISAERIEKIRSECSKGFIDIVPRLWKNVSLISGIGSKAFQTEEISIKKYIGDISIWHYIYAGSECMMAVPAGISTYDYILYPGTAYYEFYSEEDKRIYGPEELEEGKSYEIIVTTFSGFYRYVMGDVLKVTGFYGRLPKLRFLSRRNLVMNIAGEKLALDKLDRAMRHLSSETGLGIWQYFFYEDYSRVPAFYHGVVAFDDDIRVNAEELENSFDNILKDLSKDYAELRDLGFINKVVLEFVNKDNFMEKKNERAGQGGQPKPLHIMRVK